MISRRGLFGWIAAAFGAPLAAAAKPTVALARPEPPFWPAGSGFWDKPKLGLIDLESAIEMLPFQNREALISRYHQKMMGDFLKRKAA
jgi:hypothetical protein